MNYYAATLRGRACGVGMGGHINGPERAVDDALSREPHAAYAVYEIVEVTFEQARAIALAAHPIPMEP